MNTSEPVPEPHQRPAAPPRHRDPGVSGHPVPAPPRATEPAAPGTSAPAGTAPVAVTQWQIPDLSGRNRRAPTGTLSARTAGRLVGAYSRPLDIVVSVGDDPALAGAAGAGGRRYLPAAGPADLPGLRLAGAVTLIVLPWPHPPSSRPQHDLPALLRLCRQLLASDGNTIVVSPPGSGPQACDNQHGTVIASARQAGLICAQYILAVTPQRNTLTAAGPPDRAAPVVHLELLVFTATENCHG